MIEEKQQFPQKALLQKEFVPFVLDIQLFLCYIYTDDL
jgi:hypothetical protein